MDTIDKTSPLPAYYQIQQVILEKIQSGVWPVKSRIPSERELSEQFNVSRMTMRRALSELVLQGVLTREVGRGTFISEPKITQTLGQLTGFSTDMEGRGIRPSSRVLSVGIEPAALNLASMLKVEIGAALLRIERLRMADGEPLAVERCYLPYQRFHELLEEDLSRSLYGILNEKYQVIPSRASQKIRADNASRQEIKTLQMPRSAPVLHLTRLTYDQFGQPFEFVESAYRSDKYVFDVELLAQPGR